MFIRQSKFNVKCSALYNYSAPKFRTKPEQCTKNNTQSVVNAKSLANDKCANDSN